VSKIGRFRRTGAKKNPVDQEIFLVKILSVLPNKDKNQKREQFSQY